MNERTYKHANGQMDERKEADINANMDARFTGDTLEIIGDFLFLQFQSNHEIPKNLGDHENYCIYSEWNSTAKFWQSIFFNPQMGIAMCITLKCLSIGTPKAINFPFI